MNMYEMKRLLNTVSIKWKLLAAFMLVFITPIILHALHVSYVIIVVVGALLVTGIVIYSNRRILRTISNLESIINNLAGRKSADSSSKSQGDELHNVIASLDGMVNSLEHSYAKKKKANEVVPEVKGSKIRQSFHATLSSGKSVRGDIYLMPSRESDIGSFGFNLTRREGLFLLHQSIPEVKRQLTELRDSTILGDSEKGIIDFQLLLVQDKTLIDGIVACLNDDMPLVGAIETTFGAFANRLQRSKNSYIQGRSPDCTDLMLRLLQVLQERIGNDTSSRYLDAQDKIVFTQLIYPSDVIALHKVGIKGIISLEGTPSSHAMILFQSFELPSVSNVDFSGTMPSGADVMIDTSRKQMIINPSVEDIKRLDVDDYSFKGEIIADPVSLKSGQQIWVSATINVAAAAGKAIEAGADGVGLFRSEMSFIGRESIPSEEELYQEYKQIMEAFGSKPIVLRMLDLGGDKLPITQEHQEENPCMGSRSMRLLLKQPTIMRAQLRAMLRAANELTTIIFPMVNGWHELERIQEQIKIIAAELTEEEAPFAHKVEYGLMVEVPAIVERFEDYVDSFKHFNLGTNDLAQYTLAADRNNMDVADYFDPVHPSMLSMIHRVATIAAQRGKEVSLCGEMAANLWLTPLLVGLGIREFSVSANLIAPLKHMLSNLELKTCNELANQALRCRSLDQVRKVISEYNAHHND
jgi:phosphoenolpyruvate-protein phosphotransferase